MSVYYILPVKESENVTRQCWSAWLWINGMNAAFPLLKSVKFMGTWKENLNMKKKKNADNKEE